MQAVLETVFLWDFVAQRGGLSEGMSSKTLSQGHKKLFDLARAILRCRIRARDLEGGFGSAVEEKGGDGRGILL